MTTSLINKIEQLIKREKTTPERKRKDEVTKSSSEILSELFSAFNADPPKIDEVTVKKSKKSKKKHKKDKKKRSRSSSSSSDSDGSDYSHKRKKRKKSKTKKRRDSVRSPSLPPSRTPLKIKPDPDQIKNESTIDKVENVIIKEEKVKGEPREDRKRRVSIVQDETASKKSQFVKSESPKSPEYPRTPKYPKTPATPEYPKSPDYPRPTKHPKTEHAKSADHPNSSICSKSTKTEQTKISEYPKSPLYPPVFSNDTKYSKSDYSQSPDYPRSPDYPPNFPSYYGKYSKSEYPKSPGSPKSPDYPPQSIKIKSEHSQSPEHPKIKIEDKSECSQSPNHSKSPEYTNSEHPDYSNEIQLDTSDLRHKLESRKHESADNDKSKGKIQIKNLKFSAVYKETVKKAEEEAKKKARMYEDGECTGSSSGSEKEDIGNSQFPKSADPGGILRKQAADVIKIIEEEKIKKSKLPESSHKSSKKESTSKSHKRSSSKPKRSRSRSRSRRHHRSSSKSHKRSRSRHRSRSRRRSSHSLRHHSPRHNRRRSRSSSGVKLAESEKKRLLEVARRNAINMLKNGVVPAGAAALPPHTRNQVMAAIQSGGKSVDELTDFCKSLSKKEALGELSSVSSNDGMSENEDTIAFHHPFMVKDKPPIVMNIRGGVPLPVKTSLLPIANKEELRMQFPVSSGSQHREKATEWVPVSPKKDDMQIAKIGSKSSSRPSRHSESSSSKSAPLALPAPPKSSEEPRSSSSKPDELLALPAPPGPQAYPPGSEDSKKIDVASIVSQKIAMIRKEQEQIEFSIPRGFGWSKDSALGQFTGSTGAQILTPRELASGTQAWAKKDQLVRAAPVEGGMGMHLLQKMGWTPGQGLGKEGTGTLQPLLLEVKLDTKGLSAKEEASNSRSGRGSKQRGMGRRMPAGGKHPVSLLGEYCSKQKLGPPEYNLCFECGPDHKKNFLFKVKVAGVEYQPAVASANKKQAKADAAQLALENLGIT